MTLSMSKQRGYDNELTLLERFTKNGMTYGTNEGLPYIATADEVRRAIAIAQRAQQHAADGSLYAQAIINEADELLKGK